jgi:hypothetical protein
MVRWLVFTWENTTGETGKLKAEKTTGYDGFCLG